MADNIRQIAARKQMALTGLADFAGVSRSHLFAFLKGERDMTLGRLEKIAGALEVDAEDLVRAATAKKARST